MILSPTMETIQEYPPEVLKSLKAPKFPISKVLEIPPHKKYKNLSPKMSSQHLKFKEEKKKEILSKYWNTESEAETDSTKGKSLLFYDI